MQTRIKFLTALFILGFLALGVRLFFWQIVKGRDLSEQARYQHLGGNVTTAQRGNILASDGSFLAARGEAWLVWSSPRELGESPQKIANKLAPFFVDDPEDKQSVLTEVSRIETALSKTTASWIPLKHKVDESVKRNIEAMNLTGIGFDKEEMRSYPEASMAAQLLGFVGKDEKGADTGYFGLEGYYNLALSGKSGYLSQEKDARGLPILVGDSKEVTAVSGVDLLTNIDKTIQMIIEAKLKEGIEKYGAAGGNIIVARPEDGAILGMASYPSYDPAKYSSFGNEFFKNPGVSDAFEPGSIFKPIVMAGALDAGVVEPDTKCDICAGPYKVDKYFIETWDKKYRPDETMEDVIVHSDNVGMTFVGNKLGADNLYDYLKKFGIGEATGIDLQGEGNPGLRERGTWNVVDLATATFGQGIAATPIQLVRAFMVIANGGTQVKPFIVKSLIKDDWRQDIKPAIGRRIISASAARKMAQMMVAAVTAGEARWAAPTGFKIAGKTGTAQIPVSGHYDPTKTIASFVGFAPANSPKFVMLVTLREPSTSIWGSETAAPLWFSIARDLFPYLGIRPES